MLILGGLAIGGILMIQAYWLYSNWQLRTNEFDEKVTMALRNVAEKMAKQSSSELPKEGLIKKLAGNTYVVNYNNFIDHHILEDFLLREMAEISLDTVFEYALYDCFSEELVHGDCCTLDKEHHEQYKEKLVEMDGFTYYFIVRFPNRNSFLLNEIWIFAFLSVLSLVAVLAFLYAVKTIYQQKKLSELQKDFVNNMTHEFKTPLSSIRIASKVLENSPEIRENDRLMKYAQIVNEQSNRLNAQIENILEVVRSEKKFVLQKEPLDLVQLLNETIKVEENRFADKSLKVVSDIKIERFSIFGDRYHLTNLFSNIIENAVKYAKPKAFSPDDPLIVSVSFKRSNGNLELRISDEGIGIEEKHQKLIFNKFYRVPTGNVHDVKGFGLGLYYVSNICELHGWQIRLESQKDKGTDIIINIPDDPKS